MVGGILAAFAGVLGVIAMAYFAKREGFNKAWGEPACSSGSKENTLTTEERKSGMFSKAKKTGTNDLERGNAAIEKCPSPIVVQLYSSSKESAGSPPQSHLVKKDTDCTLAPSEEYKSRLFKKAKKIRKAKKTSSTDLERGNVASEECVVDQPHRNSPEIVGSMPQSLHVPMMVEDRVEIIEVEVPSMENASSLSTCSDYIEVVRESSGDSDLTMIAEVPLTARRRLGRYTMSRPTEESSESDPLSMSLFTPTSSMGSSSGCEESNFDCDNFSC